MKRSALLLLWMIPLIFIGGCVKDSVTRTYTLLTPVYQSKQSVLNEVESQPAKALSNPGKIYVYGNYLFVNEVNKGVHVIDNVNPANPVNLRFINIPGNVDIAVKGHTLYADIFTDMLTLDISDPLSVKVTKITRDVFPERSYGNSFVADTTQYIIDWVKKDTTVNMDAGPSSCINCGIWFSDNMLAYSTSAERSQAISKLTTGVSGSMARFTIVNNYLYTVNRSSLIAFDITEPALPQQANQVGVGWDIETLYPFQDKLFIGSTTGMFIYDISNPEAPAYLSRAGHVTMCDPVISDGKYAYVTLRAGTTCGGATGSQLQVLDISTSLSNPRLVKTYDLTNPYGLGKTGDLLWVCDGVDGLKLYDATDPSQLKLRQHIKGLEAFDVIPVYDGIIVSAKEGIVQYGSIAEGSIKELSRIKKQ